MKFSDGRDNYQLWAESFEHTLTLLPRLSSINKLHALVSHTKGKAHDTVLLYKDHARPGNAELQFEKACVRPLNMETIPAAIEHQKFLDN